jgi:hypothetical protein
MSGDRCEGLIEYLRSQPEDYVVNWYTDDMDPAKPWEVSWVDIMFEDHLAWVIVSGLFDDEEEDFHWPPDMVGNILIDPSRSDPYVGCIPIDPSRPVREEELQEIRAARSQVSDESYWLGAPAWSATEINRAIEDWCLRNVGRPMQARWDFEHGPSPQMVKMTELVEAMKAGIEPKYLLHPGEAEGGTGHSVYASEQVMELLMQDLVDDE